MVAEPLSDELSYTPELQERILAGFRGDVPPLRPTLAYRTALTAVAVAMVLIPLLYFGLIAVTTWGTALYSRYYFGSLIPDNGPWLVGALPLFVLVVVLVCLVKPLFARPANPDKPMRLDPKEEPLLLRSSAGSARPWARRCRARSMSTARSTPRRDSAAACSPCSATTWR